MEAGPEVMSGDLRPLLRKRHATDPVINEIDASLHSITAAWPFSTYFGTRAEVKALLFDQISDVTVEGSVFASQRTPGPTAS